MIKNQSILFLLIIALLPACSIRFGSSKYKKAIKEAFIDGFKTLTFCRCFEYGYRQEDNLAKKDVSCRVPDYLLTEMKVIDSLAKAEIINIQLDSASRVGKVAEGMEGKRIIDHCLEQYKSKKLDSFAKNRFGKVKNGFKFN